MFSRQQFASFGWKWLFLAALLILVASISNLLPLNATQRLIHRYEPADTSDFLSAPNAIPVKIGAYIENYHDLSLQNRRFVAEGYYWAEWPQLIEDIIEKEHIPPIEIFEITNQIDEWDSRIRSITEKRTRLPNGNYYFQVRFSGNFYIPDLDLRRSPFEQISLPIIIETQDESLALENHNVVLVRDDSRDSLVGSYGEIDGYKLVSVSMKPMVHSYGTSWGLAHGDLRFSAMEVLAQMRSSVLASLLIWVFPLMIVVSVVLMAPSLAGELGDIRLAIPSTGLLTLIFLQQGYRTSLPALDYLTFLDWMYACGYAVSILTFVLFVWGTNYYQIAPEEGKSIAISHINKVDSVFQVLAVVSIALGAVLAWNA
jgi:hypothetical protein